MKELVPLCPMILLLGVDRCQTGLSIIQFIKVFHFDDLHTISVLDGFLPNVSILQLETVAFRNFY